MPETRGTLTPPQAVDAAILLGAKTLVPIHYGLNDPPYYMEVPEPLESLKANAARRGLAVSPLMPGESLQID